MEVLELTPRRAARRPVAADRPAVDRVPPVAVAAPAPSRRRDPRYGSRRWQKVRLRVLNRDRWTCQVEPGCPVRANVADHIIPVYDDMPDRLFFGEGNLRAACRGHNIARGLVPDASPVADPSSAVVTRDYTRTDDAG